MAEPSQQELEAAHSWEPDDYVSGRPEMTAFRRQVRLHQSRWREAHGHPIGSLPIVPRKGTPTRQMGSRMPLAYARETGASFLTADALAAARTRASTPEQHQRFDHQRLWADLLWSPTLAFNLFGDLTADLSLADRAVHTWWPDAPGAVCGIRFEHSPGRFDPAYLGGLRSFDAAFVLDLGDGTNGVLALDVKYHERAKAETAKPASRPLQHEVARRSGIFARGAIDAADRTDLLLTSLEHLLLLSMLQHESGRWSWGRYLVIYPACNTDYADVCSRYAELLTDHSTFGTITLEKLLDAEALPQRTRAALRERYIVS